MHRYWQSIVCVDNRARTFFSVMAHTQPGISERGSLRDGVWGQDTAGLFPTPSPVLLYSQFWTATTSGSAAVNSDTYILNLLSTGDLA